MFFWGKLFGLLFGTLLAGPIGAIFGVIIGHNFDRSYQKNRPFQAGISSQTQQVFFNSTFSVMGHIAKADGQVSEREIKMARSIMQRLGLNEKQKQTAIHLFTQGKQASFSLTKALDDLKTACSRERVLLQLFVNIQLQAAYADGKMSSQARAVLRTICQQLGFAVYDFDNIDRTFRAESHYRQYQQHSTTSMPSLSDAYAVLGVSATTSAAEVKKAYRRLMNQHHPDKLVAKGLPPEMMKVATEKTQEIKSAYEQICKARGIK